LNELKAEIDILSNKVIRLTMEIRTKYLNKV
jgi:hypothetical protein